MSLDREDLLDAKSRSRLRALLWQIGDIGYYVGLLGTVVAPVTHVGWGLLRLARHESRTAEFAQSVPDSALLLAIFGSIWMLSSLLKLLAVKGIVSSGSSRNQSGGSR